MILNILRKRREQPEEEEDILNCPESECLLKYADQKMKKKKGIIFLFTGEVGDGKSYAGLRLLELWYQRHFKKEFPHINICENLPQAVLLVKDFKEAGEGILIEELSVLASARDSLTTQNKLWNKFLDTVRIKQAFIVGNLPHISFLDKHFIMMCDVWVNCLGVDFKKKICKARPLWLQTSPHKNEPYKHKFITKEGDKIDYCYFRKPQTKGLLKNYDKLKENYVQELYDEIGHGLLRDRVKKIQSTGQKILSKREMEAITLKLQLYTSKEASEKMKIVPRVFNKYCASAEEKLKKPEFAQCLKEIEENAKKMRENRGKDQNKT